MLRLKQHRDEAIVTVPLQRKLRATASRHWRKRPIHKELLRDQLSDGIHQCRGIMRFNAERCSFNRRLVWA